MRYSSVSQNEESISVLPSEAGDFMESRSNNRGPARRDSTASQSTTAPTASFNDSPRSFAQSLPGALSVPAPGPSRLTPMRGTRSPVGQTIVEEDHSIFSGHSRDGSSPSSLFSSDSLYSRVTAPFPQTYAGGADLARAPSQSSSLRSPVSGGMTPVGITSLVMANFGARANMIVLFISCDKGVRIFCRGGSSRFGLADYME